MLAFFFLSCWYNMLTISAISDCQFEFFLVSLQAPFIKSGCSLAAGICTWCDQKNTGCFNFFELRMFDFCTFFLLCWCTICWQYQPFCIVSLFLADKKRLVVFWLSSSIFYYSKTCIKETLLSFM